MQLGIPGAKEDITKDWLQNILGKHEDECIRVQEMSVEPGAERGDNFAAQVYRVKVQGKRGEDEYKNELFIKMMPNAEWHRKFVSELKIFHREVIAYNDVFPSMIETQSCEDKILPNVPRCIYADVIQDSGVVVLDDLQPKGYKMADVRQGQDVLHCRLMMEELAKLHALGYCCKYAGSGAMDKIPPRGHHNKFFRSIYLKHIENICSLLSTLPGRKIQAVKLQQQKERILDNLFETYRPTEPYATLCHGCTWNNNMLFRYDGEGAPTDMKLLDFQTIHYTCPTIDLSYFFCTSTTGELRRNHLLELLQLYHRLLFQYLEKMGVSQMTDEDFPFEVLLSRYYGFSGCFGLVQGFSKLSVVLAERDDIFNSQTESVADKREALDKMAEMARNGTAKNPNAVKRICDLIDEMMENSVI